MRPARLTMSAFQPPRARWGQGVVGIAGEGRFEHLAGLAPEALPEGRHGADALRVAAEGVARLEVPLRVGRIGAHRFLAQLQGSFEQLFLLFLGSRVVAVDRERSRRQGIAFRGPRRLGDAGGVDEAAFRESGPRLLERLRVSAGRGEHEARNRCKPGESGMVHHQPPRPSLCP